MGRTVRGPCQVEIGRLKACGEFRTGCVKEGVGHGRLPPQLTRADDAPGAMRTAAALLDFGHRAFFVRPPTQDAVTVMEAADADRMRRERHGVNPGRGRRRPETAQPRLGWCAAPAPSKGRPEAPIW